MPKFAVKPIEAIKAKKTVYELLINGVSQLDTYYNELQKSYKSEFRHLITCIEFEANGSILPAKKCKTLERYMGLLLVEYKSDHLRIYSITTSLGKTICYCGYKNSQPEDIIKFKSIVNQYIEQEKK